MASKTLATLPTRKELDAARRAFIEALGEVENVCIRIRNAARAWEDPDYETPPPTLEQIGLVYSFRTDLSRDAEQLERERDSLDVALENLDCLRLDAEAENDD